MKTCVTCGAPYIPAKPAHGPSTTVCSPTCRRAREAARLRRHRARQRATRERAEALAALAADAPRRREALVRLRADNAKRLGHLLREAAGLLAESSATAATDALLEAIEDGVDLLDPRSSTRLSRAATRAATPLVLRRTAVVGPVADRYQVSVEAALTALLEVVDPGASEVAA